MIDSQDSVLFCSCPVVHFPFPVRYDFFDSPPICPLSLPTAKVGAVFINPDAFHRAGVQKGQNSSHLPSFYTEARQRRRNVPEKNNIFLLYYC